MFFGTWHVDGPWLTGKTNQSKLNITHAVKPANTMEGLLLILFKQSWLWLNVSSLFVVSHCKKVSLHKRAKLLLHINWNHHKENIDGWITEVQKTNEHKSNYQILCSALSHHTLCSCRINFQKSLVLSFFCFYMLVTQKRRQPLGDEL